MSDIIVDIKSPTKMIGSDNESSSGDESVGKDSTHIIMSPCEEEEKSWQSVNMRPFYWECFSHSLIILYGIVILVFTFYNPINQD